MKFQKGSVRKSLYYSILDGLFTAMMVGVSESYLIPYGIALGASAKQIAYLASVPILIAAILQTHSASITQRIGSRLKLINVLVFFHALSWVPIILIPYVVHRQEWIPWALLITATIHVSFGAFSVPAWQSLMSDYIPTKKRGKYFGWRNRLQGFLTVSVSVLAGLVLHHFGKSATIGFTVIFCFAMMCRFYAWFCLTRMKEPFRHASHDAYFSFMDFLKQVRTHHYSKFVFFVAAMSFCVYISAPLLGFYFLENLGFDYASYMIVVTAAAVTSFLFQGIWGKYGDLEGNIKIVKIACWGVAIVPVFWIVSKHIAFALMIQLVAGAFWGGFNLLVQNYILEALPREVRIRGTSYFNVVNSVAMFLGSVVGAWMFQHVPALLGYSFLTLVLISCLGRVAVMIFISPKLREVRSRELV